MLPFSTFAQLVDKVQAQLDLGAKRCHVKGITQVDRAMPAFEDIVPISENHALPTIHPMFLAGFQKVKKERFLEHCTNAAMQLLPSNEQGPEDCWSGGCF